MLLHCSELPCVCCNVSVSLGSQTSKIDFVSFFRMGIRFAAVGMLQLRLCYRGN